MKNINRYSKGLTVIFQCDLGVNLQGISEEPFFYSSWRNFQKSQHVQSFLSLIN